MALAISYIRSLEEILDPVVEFLSRPVDLFTRQRIVVPSVGAKAWLVSQLAKRLGADGAGDGIVANVDISFPKAIANLLQPDRAGETDPWGLDRLTFAVLDILSSTTDLGLPFDHSMEPLLAARRIATRFDNYHVRRPAMILEWERDKPSPVLSPTASDEVINGKLVPNKLHQNDHWQFNLWRAVREHIGTPSPPSRDNLAEGALEPLLVAGLQSLSLHQLRCLQQLGERTDVRVLLVHPSAALADLWAATATPFKPGLARRREEIEPDDDSDPLVANWLQGARETQTLLVSQGVSADFVSTAFPSPPGKTLLQQLQQTVATGTSQQRQHPAHDPAQDASVTIHRCHSLSRQAEVLHDAILHAFHELKDLQPHEIVICSPHIAAASPHLKAAFSRTVTGSTIGSSSQRDATIRLPLVVADRGIREVSDGVELLAKLLSLVGSRCSVDDVLEVAANVLVRSHFGVSDDMIDMWAHFVERTNIRWGLDAGHRGRRGLDPVIGDVHSWKLGLERMLLGATLPDGPSRPELGGVVPLDDVDVSDLESIATLVRIVDLIRSLETATATLRPVGTWCDAIETTLIGLCGEDCPHLIEPHAQIRRLRDAAADSTTAVPFRDVQVVLQEQLEDLAGRQPLRTGAITATSMVSLRGVPFRVVCVIGYDDGVVKVPEPRGDDLVTRQQLVGDGDSRVDLRRSLLDCMLAASERLVITCNGMRIKNNERLPLVTPLAEFIEFAVRHGVEQDEESKPSGIEITHPRHAISPRNFHVDEVQKGRVWSHSANAIAAARVLGTPQQRAPFESHAAPDLPVIELSMIERMVKDPLKLYLEETLGIETWQEDEEPTPATFPLEFERRDGRKLTWELLGLLLKDPTAEADWVESLRQSGRLPFGTYGERQLAEICELTHGIIAEATVKKISLTGHATKDLLIATKTAKVIGHLEGVSVSSEASELVFVTPGKAGREAYGRPLLVAAVRLLAARAAGLEVSRIAIVSRHDKWKPGNDTHPAQVRTVVLAESVNPLQRLEDLCGLVRDTIARPCGVFGETAFAEKEKRPDVFQKFVDFKDFDTQTAFYPGKSEALVYGLQPTFAKVFGDGSRELAFLNKFGELLKLAGRPGTSEYRLT